MLLKKLIIPVFLLLSVVLASCSEGGGNTALGTVERDRVLLKATASEIIVAQPVQEGAWVKAGTLLVQLDERRQQARVAAARAELARTAAKWEELRNGARIEDIDAAKARVDGAEAALTVAEKNYQRARELRSKQLSTQAVLDQTVASRDSAEADLTSARQQLQLLTNGTRKEELDQAEAAHQAAQAQLELEQYQLSELSIRATRDGLLDSLPWNTGERVQPGSPVAVLLAGDAPYARVYLPEPWRAKVALGNEYPVHVDGIEKTLQGKLRWVATEPAFTPYYALNERDRARLVYLAEFDLIEQNNLAIGMPAEVMLGE
ncbi:HlyD family secretion protein [Alteromonadaceae bacterium 2753L.S.0a.02]|nr:HlyD family secretion protein [Alteromonadaceae bacterium 2753L.S.0a.02]